MTPTPKATVGGGEREFYSGVPLTSIVEIMALKCGIRKFSSEYWTSLSSSQLMNLRPHSRCQQSAPDINMDILVNGAENEINLLRTRFIRDRIFGNILGQQARVK